MNVHVSKWMQRWTLLLFGFFLVGLPAGVIAQTDADYSLIYLHRLKKSTNAGITYRVFLNDQNVGKLDGINLALSDNPKEVWLVIKCTQSGTVTLRINDNRNNEVDRTFIEASPGMHYYLAFDPAAGFGVKPIKKLFAQEGHDAFREVSQNDIEYFPKGIRKQVLADRVRDLPPETENLTVNIANEEKTQDIDFHPDSGRTGIKMETKTGTGFTPGVSAKKFFALIIGVEEYQDPEINDLDQPVKDARSFYDVLTSYYTFDPQNIAYLVNPKREEMTKALDKLVEKITPDDNLVIFYAGHGHWDEKLKQGYWLPSDARSGDRGSWFSNADLKTYIGGINARHTLLITDACFGGGIFKTREAFQDARTDIQELYKYPSRKAMTSGTLNVVPDKSVFIEYLVKRLKENPEKYLPSEQLFASFKTAVINNSLNNQIPQFGEIRETGDEGGDFIFVKKQ